MFYKTHLHNFVHELGFSLDVPARIALEEFVTSTKLASWWIDANFADKIKTLEPCDRAQHYSTMFCYILSHACCLAKMQCRTNISAIDISFMCSFLGALPDTSCALAT